ncbi:MAG: hypothetical protein WCO33_05060 [bacterium]
MGKKQDLQKYLLENKQLFWDTDQAKFDQLSDESIIERIMQYGNMRDFSILESTYGDAYIAEVFEKILNKKRVNLSKETVNFYSLYLNHNAH